MVAKLRRFWLGVSLIALIGWTVYCIDWNLSQQRSSICPFCNSQIVNPQSVWQGKIASILLTHKPILNGHVLIIPNRHVERLECLTDNELSEIEHLAKMVCFVYEKFYGNRDYFVMQKNGKTAGQSVPHVHFHLIPGGEIEKKGKLWCFLRFFITPYLKPLDSKTMDKRRLQIKTVLEQIDGYIPLLINENEGSMMPYKDFIG